MPTRKTKRPESLKCPSCGKTLAAGVTYCVTCGTSARDVQAAAALANLKADERIENMRLFGRLLRIYRWFQWTRWFR